MEETIAVVAVVGYFESPMAKTDRMGTSVRGDSSGGAPTANGHRTAQIGRATGNNPANAKMARSLHTVDENRWD